MVTFRSAVFLWVSILCWLFICISPVMAESSAAKLHIYVFTDGQPQAQVLLFNGDVPLLQTDRNGAIHTELSAGDYALNLRAADRELVNLHLSLKADESVQIIVNVPATGGAIVDLESSHGTRLQGSKDQTQQGDTSDAEDHPADMASLSGDAEATATIQGVVSSLQGGTPVPGAQIFVSGIRVDIRTDADGNFSIAVPAGVYSVSVVHNDFSTQVFDGLVVLENAVVEKNIEMTPSALELDEYVVTAPFIESGFLALMNEGRESSSVAEVISSSQLSVSGDSDAASALKRVTGLTLVDGKYVYVRGLGERYSSSLLNGAGIPSPDPTRRVVPLDLFPTGVLGSVVVQKTYSPDLPGDFSGGVIGLRTKGLPEEKVRKVAVSTGGNSNSTFKQGKTYEGGGLDFLGIDDGTRELPSALASGTVPNYVSDAEGNERAAESMPQVYRAQDQTLMPDFGFKANLANLNEQYDADWGWGYNLALEYGNQWRYQDVENNTFSQTGTGDLLLKDAFQDSQTVNQINLGSMLNLGLEIGEHSKLESITLLTRDTTNTVITEEGFLGENEREVVDTTLEWVERQLFSQQFHGEHTIESWNDLFVDWQTTFSTARRYEPDTRTYRYAKDDDGNLALSSAGDSNESSWEDLNDTIMGFGVNATYPVYDFFSRHLDIKTGIAYENRSRESELSRYELQLSSFNDIDLGQENPEDIFTDDNIDDNGFVLVSNTANTDNYSAEQTVTATYLLGELELSDAWKVMAGARMENVEQEVVTRDLAGESSSVAASQSHSDLLPAMSATWAFARDMQFRAAISQTVNRPDLKELSEAPYTDPESRDTVIGNPDLEQASILNFDLRWEWYLTPFETMQVAFFYKDFSSPIEQIVIAGNNDTLSFANVESAQNYGLEFQSRFWLSRFFGKSFSRYYFETNLSYIDSTVSLGDAGDFQTTDNRPLQGQSPYIINFLLGYENQISQTEAALLFNMVGERITEVGTQGIPDAYEQPAPQLDVVYKTRLFEGAEDDLKLSFKLKNILNSEYLVKRGGETEQSKRKGISASLSMQYSWK